MQDIKSLALRLSEHEEVHDLGSPQAPYVRADLEDLLPAKFWALVKSHGEPDVDDDPDIQTIHATHCVHVIGYVLARCQRDISREVGEKLQAAGIREQEQANLFMRLAEARRAVVASLGEPVKPHGLEALVTAPEAAVKPKRRREGA